jgi:hypothetical protein
VMVCPHMRTTERPLATAWLKSVQIMPLPSRPKCLNGGGAPAAATDNGRHDTCVIISANILAGTYSCSILSAEEILYRMASAAAENKHKACLHQIFHSCLSSRHVLIQHAYCVHENDDRRIQCGTAMSETIYVWHSYSQDIHICLTRCFPSRLLTSDKAAASASFCPLTVQVRDIREFHCRHLGE